MSAKSFPHHDRPMAAGMSNVGMVRTRNEDSHWIPSEDYPVESLDAYGRLFAVADGMGGHSGGDVASKAVIETLIGTFYAASTDDVFTRLQRGVDAANTAVVNGAAADPTLADMGATLTAVVLHGTEPFTATLAHVGDSRAYLIRDGVISQISEEHTFIAEAIRTHTLTEDEAAAHPNRHAITRAMGRAGGIQAQYGTMAMIPGDRLLLCSDGLTNVVTDNEILQHALAFPPDEAVQRLIDLANNRGGPDNITAVLIALPGAEITSPAPLSADTSPVAPTVRLEPLSGGPGGVPMGGSLWHDGPAGVGQTTPLHPQVAPPSMEGRRALAIQLGAIAAVSMAVVGLMVATSLGVDREVRMAQQAVSDANQAATMANSRVETAEAALEPTAIAVAKETSRVADENMANANATLWAVRTAVAVAAAPSATPARPSPTAVVEGAPRIELSYPVGDTVHECTVPFKWEFVGAQLLDTTQVVVTVCPNGKQRGPNNEGCTRRPANADYRSYDLPWDQQSGEQSWWVESTFPNLKSEEGTFNWEARNCGEQPEGNDDDNDDSNQPRRSATPITLDTPMPEPSSTKGAPPTIGPIATEPPTTEPTEPITSSLQSGWFGPAPSIRFP